jgi:hypothetical protein
MTSELIWCGTEVNGKNLVANNIESYERDDSYQPDQMW